MAGTLMDKYYNFTDSVGQNWIGYFLAGNYSIYMHDNVTIVFNGSWILSNIYPSTFLPLLPHPDFVTIEDVKGFSSVQVTLIEPVYALTLTSSCPSGACR